MLIQTQLEFNESDFLEEVRILFFCSEHCFTFKEIQLYVYASMFLSPGSCSLKCVTATEKKCYVNSNCVPVSNRVLLMASALFVLLSLSRGVLLLILQTPWSQTSEVSLFKPSTIHWLFKETERSRIRLCAASSSGIYVSACFLVFFIISRSQRNHLILFCRFCIGLKEI